MFVVDAHPTFTHTVKIKVPVDGGFEEQTLKATFSAINTEEMARFDLNDGASSTEFLKRIVVELDDLVGKDKRSVAYNDAVRDQLFGLQYVRSALATAYMDAILGSRLGN